MNQGYKVLDEPSPKRLGWLCVSPLLILFVSVLAPIFFSIPMMGRYWMPFAWLILNGFLMGSPTRWKEAIIGVSSVMVIAATFFAWAFFFNLESEFARSTVPYLKIVIQALLFFSLYWVVFIQSKPYQIFEYVKELNSRNDL